MDAIEWAKIATAMPLTVLLALVLIGGSLGWWIYGSIHRAEMDDKDKQLADTQARAAMWEARYLDLSLRGDAETKKGQASHD